MNSERRRRAMEVFQDLLAQEPSRQDAFLAEACRDDSELLAEVASLLAHHRSETLLPQPAPNSASVAGKDHGAILARQLPRVAAADERRWLLISRTVAVLGVCLVLLTGALGLIVRAAVQRALQRGVVAQLQTVLAADAAAVQGWLGRQRDEVQHWAGDRQIRRDVQDLVALSRKSGATTADLQSTPPFQSLLGVLSQEVDEDGVRGAYILNREGMLIFATEKELDGSYYLSSEGARNATPVFLGKTVMTPPYRAGSQVVGAERFVAEHSFMAAGAPVRDDAGRVMAALVFVFDAGKEFTRLLNLARSGASGETYAFDRQGLLLSESRFTDQVRRLGLIPSQEPAALNLRIADPGGDLAAGFCPSRPPAAWPLTEAVARAASGENGVSEAGYRDYRGATVIGAWRWLDEFDFGIVTEIDAHEAYSPVSLVAWSFGVLLGVLVVVASAAAAASVIVVRLRGTVDEARRLGQYVLEELIGEGGMGKVYRAQHALLKRPTAIKILNRQPGDSASIGRFEREVRLASSLSHPNTVQIYDYGYTPDGVFFYAMEFLSGITLQQLVDRTGVVCPARVIYILRQICGALEEAHGLGLVHRDIKPGNIMLCRRGGMNDVVKVLDFGLAREMAVPPNLQITSRHELSGTPLYIAPERIRDPVLADPRSDLYAMGATAYLLLTGAPLFRGETPLEIFQQTLHAAAPVPSQVKEGIPPQLDELLRRCLAKDPDDRPACARAMCEDLDELGARHPWCEKDAQLWWTEFESHERKQSTSVAAGPIS